MSSRQQLPSGNKTLLEQTLHEIEQRVIFFSRHNLSAENFLLPSQANTIRSISEIITPLKFYDIADTPLNSNLSTIYSNEQSHRVFKWSIPPASEGQDSINEEEVFQPSFRWLASSFVDPSLLKIDQPQPVRIQKGKVPQEWNGVTSLLLYNVSTKIHIKSQILAIQKSIKKRFSQRYSWMKFKRLRQIYYKGKPCLIMKFSDSNSASFVYYSYATFKSNRQQLGQSCEVFRILADNTREYQQQKNWILVLFRHLPLIYTKQQLLAMFKQSPQIDIKWMEELVEICGAKYTIAKVNYLDDALALCTVFNTKKIRDAKVNLHPKSSKNWRAEEVMMQMQGEVRNQNQKQAQDKIQKSY